MGSEMCIRDRPMLAIEIAAAHASRRDSLCYGGLSVTSEFNFFKTFHHTVLPMSPTPYEVGEDTYTALHDGKQL